MKTYQSSVPVMKCRACMSPLKIEWKSEHVGHVLNAQCANNACFEFGKVIEHGTHPLPPAGDSVKDLGACTVCSSPIVETPQSDRCALTECSNPNCDTNNPHRNVVIETNTGQEIETDIPLIRTTNLLDANSEIADDVHCIGPPFGICPICHHPMDFSFEPIEGVCMNSWCVIGMANINVLKSYAFETPEPVSSTIWGWVKECGIALFWSWVVLMAMVTVFWFLTILGF